MTSDCTAWRDWVTGESSRAVWFYRSIGTSRPPRTTRWRHLASTLTSPDYLANYDYNRTKVVEATAKARLSSDYLNHMDQYTRRVDGVLRRSGSQVSTRPARGVRLKGHEPTEEELNQLLIKLKSRSVRNLPRLNPVHDMATQLKQERAKRKALEEQLAAMQQS